LESINAAKNEKTNISSKLFDVEFDIFYLPIKKEWDDSFVYSELDKIYDTIFPKEFRGKKVFLSYM